ncbi:hypothetical protein [Carbonactinospora thermoautotrophica]|nr:hypothetical protein [Carbonactinospora thermoautotrophica]
MIPFAVTFLALAVLCCVILAGAAAYERWLDATGRIGEDPRLDNWPAALQDHQTPDTGSQE